MLLLTVAAAVFGAGAGVTGAGGTGGSAFGTGELSGAGGSGRVEDSVAAVVGVSLFAGSVSTTGCVVGSTGIVGTS